MNEVKYEIAKIGTCEQQLQVMKRGCCSSIIKGDFYLEGNVFNVTTVVSGFFHLETFLKNGSLYAERFESSAKLYKDTLGWLRKIVEALLLSEDYLIPSQALSIRLEDLYYESEQGPALLLLKPSQGEFFEKVCKVCDEIFAICPQSNADIIRKQLQIQNANALLSLQDLLRLLSSWACELN